MKSTESTKSKESGDFEESSLYMSLSRVFSQCGPGTPKQHKQTDETLHGTAPDTVKEQLESTFFSFCSRHDLYGILFSLRLLFSDEALAWFPAIPSVAISKVNGKTRKCANNHRKMVN